MIWEIEDGMPWLVFQSLPFCSVGGNRWGIERLVPFCTFLYPRRTKADSGRLLRTLSSPSPNSRGKILISNMIGAQQVSCCTFCEVM